MKRGTEWYKREPRAMLDAKREAKMTPIQAAIYDVAIDLIYDGAGETPNDPMYFAAHFSGVSAEIAEAAINDLVGMKKLISDGKFLTQKRAKIEAKSKQSLREVRSKAGKLGGQKSGKARKNKNIEASASAKQRSKTNQTRLDKSRIDKTREDPPLTPPRGNGAGGKATVQDDSDSGEVPPKTKTEIRREIAQSAMEAFQAIAGTHDLAKPKMLTSGRISAITARLEEHGLEGIQTVLDKVAASDFLLGRKPGVDWKCDFDWVFRPTNFLKIMEGKYDNQKQGTNGKGPRAGDDFDDVFARSYERMYGADIG